MSLPRTVVTACLLFVLSAVFTSAQSWLTNDLIAHYTFSGNALDVSGNGRDGVADSVILIDDRAGFKDAAYEFHGNSSVITVPHDPVFNFPTNGDFTISLWAALHVLEPTAAPYYLIAKDNGGGPQLKWIFGISAENSLFLHFNNPGDVGHWLCDNREYRIAADVWRHYVVTKLASTFSVYIDGQLFTAEISSSEIPADISAGMTIGHAEGASIKGKLDDIRIYSRALSPQEVAHLFSIEAPLRLDIGRAVYVQSSWLQVGSNYQLQASGDFLTWTNVGDSFLATNRSWRATNFWEVEKWNSLHFRLQPR